MAKDKIILAELDFDTKNLVKAAQDTKKEMEALMERQEKLAKKGKENSAEFIRNEAVLKSLTQAYEEQSNAIAAHMSQTEKMGATFNDFKTRAGEAFNSINIFNGGLGDFLSRTNEAGSTGKLFKGAIDGMATGIKGMGSALKANPLGAFLSIIGFVIDKLLNFTPLTNAMQKAFAALAPVIEWVNKPIELLASGIEAVAGWLGKLTGATSPAAEGLEKVAEAQSRLNSEMLLQEELNATAKKQVDELIAKSKDQTLSEEARLKALEDAAVIEKKNYDERKALANEAYNLAFSKFQLEKGLSDEEIQTLQKGTKEKILALQESKGITAEELKTLQETKAEKQRIADEEAIMNKRQADNVKAVRDQADAQEAADARDADQKRKEQQDKAIERQRQKLDLFEAEKKGRGETLEQQLKYEEDYAKEAINILRKQLDLQKISWYDYRKEVLAIEENMKESQLDINRTKAQLELDQLIANEGFKAKTLEEEVILAKKVAEKKLAIAQMELDAHKGLANAQAKFNLEKKRIENEELQKQAELAVDNARREFEAFKENKENQLSENAIVNETMLADEKAKLDALKSEEILYQEQRKLSGLISVQEFEDAKNQIEADAKAKSTALDEKFEQDKRAKEAIDLENKRLADTTNMQYDLDAQIEAFNATYTAEKEAAQKAGADMAVFEKAKAEERKAIEQSVLDNKLQLANQTFGNIAAIVGKESAVGKAMAVAQATIDTYQAATAAYKAMAGIPVVGPALAGVAAAAAVAAGIQNVKKITGTKTPKAEKGALFSIGGQRHSAGGTLFTGADGTRFEAEQGELIGVMNRNAARHFMAFNNAFPAGGSTAPNYFANGGIVSREIAQQQLNVDELATKIAAANAALPQPVVAVHDIITQGNSYVQVRDGANF